MGLGGSKNVGGLRGVGGGMSTSRARAASGSRAVRKTNKLYQGIDVSSKYGTKKSVTSPKSAVKAVKEVKTRVSSAMGNQYKVVKDPKFNKGFGPQKVKSRTGSTDKAPVKPSSGRMNKKGKK